MLAEVAHVAHRPRGVDARDHVQAQRLEHPLGALADLRPDRRPDHHPRVRRRDRRTVGLQRRGRTPRPRPSTGRSRRGPRATGQVRGERLAARAGRRRRGWRRRRSGRGRARPPGRARCVRPRGWSRDIVSAAPGPIATTAAQWTTPSQPSNAVRTASRSVMSPTTWSRDVEVERLRDRGQPGRVAHEVAHLVAGVHDGPRGPRPDEAGAAGEQDLHAAGSSASGRLAPPGPRGPRRPR